MCLALCISSLILPNLQEVDTVALPPLQMKVTLQLSRLKEVTEATLSYCLKVTKFVNDRAMMELGSCFILFFILLCSMSITRKR